MSARAVDARVRGISSDMFAPHAGWNAEFLAAHPDSYLNTCLKVMHSHDPDVFVSTCCEFTAEAIMWKLGIDTAPLEAQDVSFPEAEARASTFLVNISGGDHVLVVHDGHVYQSYYKKYTVRATPVTDEIRAAFDDLENRWAALTGVRGVRWPPPEPAFFLPR